jgi:hypothetical protein
VIIATFHLVLNVTDHIWRDEMATEKKKSPAKRKNTAASKKAAAKKSPAKKKTPAEKKPVKVSVFRDVFKEAWDQVDEWVDTAKLKAKQLAAEEQLMEKKAELAVKAEIDKARHLADQAEKWVRGRIKSDTKKLNSLEKKLKKKLRDAEKKLRAQAKAAEKKANKKGKELKKTVQGATKKTPAKAKKTSVRKIKAAPRKAKAKASK